MANKLIYILDDSSVARLLLEKKLKSGELFNVDIRSFESEYDFMKEFRTNRPDVVIIDYYLQGRLTAPAVIKAIRLIDENVILLTISSCEDPDIAVKAIKSGANNFTTKRDFDGIIRMVKNHLRVRAITSPETRFSELVAITRQKNRERLMASEIVSLSKLIKDTFVQTRKPTLDQLSIGAE